MKGEGTLGGGCPVGNGIELFEFGSGGGAPAAIEDISVDETGVPTAGGVSPVYA